MKVRIKFRKFGVMRFIGHLDIMRYFQKAIRRADIDIKYSTGFSPHQVMSFAAPLGVGMESNGEYFDIEVNSISNSKEMLAQLNAVMVPGIVVESIKLLPEGAKNAMASVSAARYIVTWKDEKNIPDNLAQMGNAFFEQPSIVITKQTKKNTMEFDMKPGIFEYNCSDNKLEFLVNASSSGNIKPSLLMEAFYEQTLKQPFEPFGIQITKVDSYYEQGTELVPLDAAGDEF